MAATTEFESAPSILTGWSTNRLCYVTKGLSFIPSDPFKFTTSYSRIMASFPAWLTPAALHVDRFSATGGYLIPSSAVLATLNGLDAMARRAEKLALLKLCKQSFPRAIQFPAVNPERLAPGNDVIELQTLH